MKIKSNCGQATIEYILIFAFMSLIGIGVGRTIGTGIKDSVMSLGFALSQELTTGVCSQECFYSSYKNRVSD